MQQFQAKKLAEKVVGGRPPVEIREARPKGKGKGKQRQNKGKGDDGQDGGRKPPEVNVIQ
eukprot:12028840-Karenia_brevis.AAC.1